MKKYLMAWTLKDGRRIADQIYTAESISNHLKNLEEWGAYDITMTEYKEDMNAYGLTRTEEGYIFKSRIRTYSLYEGMSVGADEERTSDIIFIMDDNDVDRDTKMVGFVYGASELNGMHVTYSIRETIERMISDYEREEQA